MDQAQFGQEKTPTYTSACKRLMHSESFKHTDNKTTVLKREQPSFKRFPCFYASSANTMLAFLSTEIAPPVHDKYIFDDLFGSSVKKFANKKQETIEETLSEFMQIESIQ